MLSSRFIASALQILLFAQHSHEVSTTQGSSSNTTDAFSSNPVVVDATIGNTLVNGVEKRGNKNLVAPSL